MSEPFLPLGYGDINALRFDRNLRNWLRVMRLRVRAHWCCWDFHTEATPEFIIVSWYGPQSERIEIEGYINSFNWPTRPIREPSLWPNLSPEAE